MAIVVDHGAAMPAEAGGHGAAAPKPPEGYGPLPQEAAVRDIVTDTLTDVEDGELTERPRPRGAQGAHPQARQAGHRRADP